VYYISARRRSLRRQNIAFYRMYSTCITKRRRILFSVTKGMFIIPLKPYTNIMMDILVNGVVGCAWLSASEASN
jgi:hypothetical protein